MNTTNNFTYSEIFKESWVKTKENAWFLFCVFLIAGVIVGATRHLFIISSLVGLFVGLALITVSLTIVHGVHPKFSDLIKSFKSYEILWHYILASVIYMIVVVVGLILLILPGIYLAVRLQFYKFLVVDNQKMTAMEALKESMKMTEGKFWKLFGFIIVLVIINIIGAIPFGLGLIVTIPVSLLATTFLYRKLLAPKQAA